MESGYRSGFASAPTASDIVFAGASAVNGPQETLTGAPTASDILFAEASAVAAPESRPRIAPAASDIVFAGASSVFAPHESFSGVPTASDIVFARASSISGPQKNPDNAFTASSIVFAEASNICGPQITSNSVLVGLSETKLEERPAEISLSQSNQLSSQFFEDVSQHKLTVISTGDLEENESRIDRNQIWGRDEIEELFFACVMSTTTATLLHMISTLLSMYGNHLRMENKLL